jgi:hypothetical protein
MPNPKDYMPPDKTFVGSYVRRKPYTTSVEEAEGPKKTALWWFDRLCLTAWVIALVVTFFLDKLTFYILLGVGGMIFFLIASTRTSRQHRKNKTAARRIWRRLI